MAAAVLAAAFLFVALPLPQRRIVLPAPAASTPTALGSFHIHTNRSDGSGSPEDVAAAAARAGLNFIVLTDHGDGTRNPEDPRYLSGVLVIDGVELSTQGGHYIAVGLPQAPYPLRGEARDVAADVRRLGGFGIVAHPHSAKSGLRWHDWEAEFDGMEWLNADTEWRDEGLPELVRALARYPFRPAETLASLLDRPDASLARWDAMTQQRPVVAVAGADAHARAGWMDDDDVDGYGRGWFLRIPSYDASFRTFAMRVALESPLEQAATVDAAQVIAALKRGAVYTAIDALASPAFLEFSGSAGGRRFGQGERFNDPAAEITFTARTNASGGAIILRKNGSVLAQGPPPALTHRTMGEGTYRVELSLPGAPGDPPIPWILSNPIYVRSDGWGSQPLITEQEPSITRGIQGGPWHVEKNDDSTAQVEQKDYPRGPVAFTFRLAAGDRTGYAALGIGVGKALTERTHLAFRARASRPMRMSVQARHPQSGNRWQRSIYLDADPRDVIVRFAEMTHVGGSSARLDPSLADTLLFVVDTTNTSPGTAGSFTLENLRVER